MLTAIVGLGGLGLGVALLVTPPRRDADGARSRTWILWQLAVFIGGTSSLILLLSCQP